MSVQELSLLIGLIAEGVALVGTIVAFAKKVIKSIKETKLKQLIEETMADVEVLAVSGDIKKTKVLERVVKVYGESAEIYKKASDYIEECIEFSKKINHK